MKWFVLVCAAVVSSVLFLLQKLGKVMAEVFLINF